MPGRTAAPHGPWGLIVPRCREPRAKTHTKPHHRVGLRLLRAVQKPVPGGEAAGKQPRPGQPWQGGRAGSTAGTEAASAAFYSQRGQVDTDIYLLRTCFLNITGSDYCPQISLQNLRVIGFYNAVKKDINWFGD